MRVFYGFLAAIPLIVGCSKPNPESSFVGEQKVEQVDNAATRYVEGLQGSVRRANDAVSKAQAGAAETQRRIQEMQQAAE